MTAAVKNQENGPKTGRGNDQHTVLHIVSHYDGIVQALKTGLKAPLEKQLLDDKCKRGISSSRYRPRV